MDDEYEDELDEETPSEDETDEEQDETAEEQDEFDEEQEAEQKRNQSNWQNLQTVKAKEALGQKRKFWQWVISIVLAAMPVILVVGLVVVAVMAIVSALSSVFSSNSDGTASSEFGGTGEYFYGIRTVYRDEGQATADIIADYVTIVDGVVTTIEADSSISTAISGTVDLADLADFDFSTLLEASAEADFATSYPALYTLLSDMAKTVYDVDNPGTTATFATNYNLVDYASGVSYFGYNSTILADIKMLVSDYISAYYTFTTTADGNVTSTVLPTALDSVFSAQTSTRTEKLYIKDYILSADENDANYRISGIGAEDYVAYIFMPKTSVTFSYFSFALKDIDLEKVSVYIQTPDGDIYDLTCDEDNTLTDEDTGDITYLFESSNNLNVTAGQYANINTADLSYLADGKSIYEIATETGGESSVYLGTTTDAETGETILTWAEGGVMTMVENEADGAFWLVEYETDCE